MGTREPGSLSAKFMRNEDFEIYIDTNLANSTACMMKRTLRIARAKGKHGWWDSRVCPLHNLKSMLHDKLYEGDLEAVIVLSAMVLLREEQEKQDEH